MRRESLAHILFVESNPIGFEGIIKAKEQGHRVTFVTTDLDYYRKRKQLQQVYQKIDRIIELSSYEPIDQVEKDIRKYLTDDEPDSIMTFNELHINVAAELTARFGLKGINPNAAKRARDKWACRMIFAKRDIPTPRFQYVETLESTLKVANTIRYPVVVKPKDGTGSLYVRCIHNDDEMKEYFKEVDCVKEYGRSIKREKGFLVEEFIQGLLVSAETITFNGETYVIGITERDVSGYPYFVEIGSLFPSLHDKTMLIKETAILAIDALEIDFGICHIEMIIGNNGPVVIEVNPRLAGGLIPKLIELSTGVDMIQTAINLHLGISIDLMPRKQNYAYSFHYTPPCEGKLIGIKGWDEIVASQIVANAAWWKEEGSILPKLESNFDRLGYVVVESENGNDIKLKIKQLNQQLKLIMECKV